MTTATRPDLDDLTGLDFTPGCERRGCERPATHLLRQTRPCCTASCLACMPCVERQQAYLASHLVLVCRRHGAWWRPTPGCLTVRPIDGRTT